MIFIFENNIRTGRITPHESTQKKYTWVRPMGKTVWKHSHAYLIADTSLKRDIRYGTRLARLFTADVACDNAEERLCCC